MNQAGDKPLVGFVWRWQFLAGVMNEMGLKTFVEIGCKEGRTASHILSLVEGSTVVAVDPWKQVEATSDKTRETYKDWDFAEIEKTFWSNIGDRRDRVTMLKMTSVEAAKMFPVEQFDMVFIDALHDYDSVIEDIDAWWPKVRTGGVLCGHDWAHKWVGVERAVADRFDLMQVGLGPDSVWFTVKHDGE